MTAGGVIGSGTHNTGIKHGILATQVSSLASMLTTRERGGWVRAPSPLSSVLLTSRHSRMVLAELCGGLNTPASLF